jgi:hypothetical protein
MFFCTFIMHTRFLFLQTFNILTSKVSLWFNVSRKLSIYSFSTGFDDKHFLVSHIQMYCVTQFIVAMETNKFPKCVERYFF